MKMFRWSVLLTLFTSLLGITGYSQEYSVTTYKEHKGQPNTIFKSVCKDSLGFVWVGSDDGLIRFDGNEFYQFKKNLPSRYIKSFLYTKSKRLFASTDDGIVEIHAQVDTATITTLLKGRSNTEKDGLVYPKMMYEDVNGGLWVAEEQAVTSLINGKRKRYHFNPKDKARSYFNSFSIIDDKQGNLFTLSQPGNLFRFDAQLDSFIEYPEVHLNTSIENVICSEPGVIIAGGSYGIRIIHLSPSGEIQSVRSVSDMNVSCFSTITNNKLLVSTWANGIYTLDISTKEPSVPQRINSNKVNKVYHYYETDEHNIWIASDEGVILLRPTFFSTKIKNLPQRYVQTVQYLPDGRIYTQTAGQVLRSKLGVSPPTFEKYGTHPGAGYIVCYLLMGDTLVASTTDGKITFLKDNEVIHTIDLSQQGKTIPKLFTDAQHNLWACQDGNTSLLKISANYQVQKIGKKEGVTHPIHGGILTKDKRFFAYSAQPLFLHLYNPQKKLFENITDTTGLHIKNNFYIHDVKENNNGDLLFATTQGIITYSNKKLTKPNYGIYDNLEVKALEIDQNNNIWIANENGLFKLTDQETYLYQTHNGLLNNNVNFRTITVDSSNTIWVGTSQGLSLSVKNNAATSTPEPYICNIKFDGKTIQDLNKVPANANLNLKIASLIYPSHNISYQTRLVPSQSSWQNATKNNVFFAPKLKAGNYKLMIRAKQDGNHKWSQPTYISFTILQHWYLQWWVITLFAIGAILLVSLIVRFNTHRLEQQKKQLELIVAERTQQISQKQVLLEAQKDKLEKNKEKIESSIKYAQTIQNAILPIQERLQQLFQHFLIYKPKDIVSGDFYWIAEQKHHNDKLSTYMSVVDCSGHGVPGAFMSMIGNSLLNEIVKLKQIYEPADILTQLHKSVREALKQDKTDNNDGMDLVLIRIESIDKNTFDICFSGAKNKIYIFRQKNKSLESFKGDRKSIGGTHSNKPDHQFSQQHFTVTKGDIIYLSTDGYIDQHNTERKRLSSKTLTQLLQSIGNLPVIEQKEQLENTLQNHQQQEKQRDDITFLGLQI